ncbi:hypothetical protein CLAFUW4_12520 [Fulvia fulva]|uniref:Uncharacterized protein n=1 Tax=Passalora fulva TaxID=5499 RepID=A0A9Q8PEF1_PASFU|nr:uncharacterized protein CLAFUR5_11546 [Fulvia fulva]KAK4617568.1 hypothetical protein CLAFUR4_12525 [Fulvia fulva]KAK4618516.1 hypothetical protein CLAFUR0_12536 [Fulvia fulva]UJO20929.1 hypothetical protein CLAFUR5_11546 [Fulvia fulva]WPV18168.1 hypothetical protein CLAFUW4_12520 [Fulvia fulva]WPV33195.1 hypothetical protein CLAFUW7_12527 [Fulvia fulva]
MSESRPWLHDLVDIRQTELANDLPHEIETLSRNVHSALNSGHFDHNIFTRVADHFEHVTPDFSGFTDVGRGVMLLQDIINARKKMTEANPGYRSVVTDSHTYVDKNLQLADVMLVIRHVGLPGGREEDGVQILRWRKGKGGWMCTRSTTMRCAPGLTDEVTGYEESSSSGDFVKG